MTKKDVERRLSELEGDEGTDEDNAEVDGMDIYYSDGDGGVYGPDGEHIPSERVEVLEEYGGFRRIDIQDEDV